MSGQRVGAWGAVEAVVLPLTIRDQVIAPTINLQTPDPECDLDYVPTQARRADIGVALSNSFGLGGHNASVIFSRYALLPCPGRVFRLFFYTNRNQHFPTTP